MTDRDIFRALVNHRLDELVRSGSDIQAVGDIERQGLELLLCCEANLDLNAAKGVTPLQIAVDFGLDDVAVWLLEHGADFSTADRFGLTPLHYAFAPKVVEHILAKGVSVDLKAHSTGYTPLHYSAYHNNTEKARLLVSRGADVEARGKGGETPLHLLMALKYRDVEQCGSILVDAGADIDAQDDQGNTPLHWAVGTHRSEHWMDRGNPKAAAFLLDHKANARLRNRQGMTPVALAWRCADVEYREAFQQRLLHPTLRDRVRILV